MDAALGAADGHCDGLLDRSLLGASMGDSLGCIDGHGLGSADAIEEGMALGV